MQIPVSRKTIQEFEKYGINVKDLIATYLRYYAKQINKHDWDEYQYKLFNARLKEFQLTEEEQQVLMKLHRQYTLREILYSINSDESHDEWLQQQHIETVMKRLAIIAERCISNEDKFMELAEPYINSILEFDPSFDPHKYLENTKKFHAMSYREQKAYRWIEKFTMKR